MQILQDAVHIAHLLAQAPDFVHQLGEAPTQTTSDSTPSEQLSLSIVISSNCKFDCDCDYACFDAWTMHQSRRAI